MGLNAKEAPRSGGSRPAQEPFEAGNYPCRVVQVIDLGLQPQRPYEGQEKPPAYELMVTYEFTDEFVKDEDGNEQTDKPRWLSETFALRNLDSDLAKSTKRYKALDPNLEHDGDWSAIAGTPCMVTVTSVEGSGKHAGKIFNNIGGVAPMRSKDAEKTPELKNEPKILNLDEPSLEIFTSLPDFVQDKVKANLEFRGSKLEKLLASHGTDKPAEQPKDEYEAPEYEEAGDNEGAW